MDTDAVQSWRAAGLGEGGVKACGVCQGDLAPTRKGWIRKCRRCGALRSALVPRIGTAAVDGRVEVLDEPIRAGALHNLRITNYRSVLKIINPVLAQRPGRLLDVGSAHGWFLAAARASGLDTAGVEPDPAVAEQSIKNGHRVWLGYFPDAVPPGETFDIISFNDVLEHIPDLNTTLVACSRVLRRGGLLVICMPSSKGVLFRVAGLLDLVGLSWPIKRLWQYGFPSPHLHYLHPDLVAVLAARHGFTETARVGLKTVAVRGLWARIRYDRSTPTIWSILAALGVSVLAPLLHFLPKDTNAQVFTLSLGGGDGQ